MRQALSILVAACLVLSAPGPFAHAQASAVARLVRPGSPVVNVGLPRSGQPVSQGSPGALPAALGSIGSVLPWNSAPSLTVSPGETAVPSLETPAAVALVQVAPSLRPKAQPVVLPAAPGEDSSPLPQADELAKMPDAQAKEAGDKLMDRVLGIRPAKASADLADPAPAPVSLAGSVERLGQGLRVYADEPERHSLDRNTVNDLGLGDNDEIFKALDKTHTYFGAVRLRRLVQSPFLDSGEIRKRQEAVRTLLQDSSLRSSVEAAFKTLGAKADHRLWTHFFEPKTDRVIHFILPNILGFAFPVTLIGWGWRLAVQLTMPWLMLGGRSLSALQELRAAFLRYKAVFRLAKDLAKPLSASGSPVLQEIGKVFSAAVERGHPLGLKAEAGTFSRVQNRAVMLPFDILCFVSAKTLWWVQRVFLRARERIAHLLGAMAELDVYMGLAKLAMENAAWSLPVIRDPGPAYLKIEAGHHPLVLAYKGGQSVANSLDLEAGAGNFRLVTGSNMGGKTTYLRMAALLSILAQAGLPVPAQGMELTPLEVATSIDITDSLKEGKSLYDAETDRVLSIVRKAEGSKRFLAVMDEILQGTNPEERTAAERAIVRYLARTPNLFMVATHNLGIAELASEVAGIRNYHVEDRRSDGEPGFPYEVKPGPATTRNGIATLEKKGFPEEIVKEARESVSRPQPVLEL